MDKIERLQSILLKVLVVLLIVIVSIQVGIRHGRKLQIEETKKVLDELEYRIDRIQKELEELDNSRVLLGKRR